MTKDAINVMKTKFSSISMNELFFSLLEEAKENTEPINELYINSTIECYFSIVCRVGIVSTGSKVSFIQPVLHFAFNILSLKSQEGSFNCMIISFELSIW